MVNRLDIWNLYYKTVIVSWRDLFLQYCMCLSVIPPPKYPTEL